jgi:RNA polymerase sigma-70 factor (ECF subfamily)
LEVERLSDEQLLDQFIAGRRACFDALVRRHEDRIFALALRMMGDRSEALDASQEIFLTLWRRASSFRGDSSFSTWLYRIGINTCHDLLRKRKRVPQPQEELPEPVDAGPDIEEGVAVRMDLARALAEIQSDYRDAVLMHDLGGVPYEEIARLTGVPVGTVKSRISRGRRALAAALEHRLSAESSKPPGARSS